MSTALTEVPGWYIEFQAALLRQAPRPGEIDQIVADGWTKNQKDLKKNLAGCLLPQSANAHVEPTKPELLLEAVGTVPVSATTSNFVAKDRFVVNTKPDALVQISAVQNNFTSWFLSGKGKIEDPISEQALRYHKLRRTSMDGSIITELGSEAKAETTLSEMFSLMEKQKNGQGGALLNNGYFTVFYIRDQNGVLRAVSVRGRNHGWDVDAYSVEGADGWNSRVQVFSRNPVLKSSETLAPAQA